MGWCELGLPHEGLKELEELGCSIRDFPQLIPICYRCHADMSEWAAAFEVASHWVAVQPEEPVTWLCRAYAARRRPGGGLAESLSLLTPAAELFPDDWKIPFNLACYQAQLGDLPSARSWLERASSAGNAAQVRILALKDPDLAPLWPELESQP